LLSKQDKQLGVWTGDTFWPIFVDVIVGTLLVSLFLMMYQFFASSENFQMISIKAQQNEFSDNFEAAFIDEIADSRLSTNCKGLLQRIALGEEVLFDLGSAQIKPEGLEILQRCLAVLDEHYKNYQSFERIQIEGHTDSLQIQKNNELWNKGIKDNWDLGAARANNVVRYFIENADIPPNRFSASSHAWYQWEPQSLNEDMSRNRKVEIVLMYKNAATDSTVVHSENK